MMSHLLCHMLLLMVLTGRAVVPVKASNDTIRCGYDNCCQAMGKLLTAFNELTADIAKDLKELKGNMNRSLASTAAISTQLSHDISQTDLVQNIYLTEFGPQDCTDIRAKGFSISGVYRVYAGRIATDVYCDFRHSTESWLVFQRRRDGTVNFNRTWTDYERGFGVLNGEFWLGNEKLSLLTMNKMYKLRIELEDFEGQNRWAEYSMFSVRPSTDKYRVIIGKYSGNAGDSFTYQNNMMFSTMDVDNDIDPSHCAKSYAGGWWFKDCHYSNLNGLYHIGSNTVNAIGVYWYYWKGPLYSLKAAEMKITAVK